MCVRPGMTRIWRFLRFNSLGVGNVQPLSIYIYILFNSDGQLLRTKLFFHVFSTENVGTSQHLEHTHRRLFEHLDTLTRFDFSIRTSAGRDPKLTSVSLNCLTPGATSRRRVLQLDHGQLLLEPIGESGHG